MKAALLLAIASAATSAASSPFHWQPCNIDGIVDPLLECGALTVPLDHLNPTNGQTIDIAVRRYRTTSASPKGTILLNPGGPGGSGLGLASPMFVTVTGGDYDVLGFDPRGIGASRAALCTQSRATGDAETRNLNAKPIPFDAIGSDRLLERYEVEFELQAKRCVKYDGDYLPYLSTAYVARDMDLIRAALGQDVLHYYGISYGTFLGLTYVNMFPDRVGRVIIDSVLTPTLYLGSTPTLMSQSLVDTENDFDGFCAACEDAGPAHCPLADATAARPYLSRRLRAFFAQVDRKPLIVATDNDDVTAVYGQDLRKLVFGHLPGNTGWPNLASLIHSYMNGTVIVPSDEATTCGKTKYTGQDIEWSIYVSNDGNNSATKASDWEDHLRRSQAVSPLFGGGWFVPALVTKYWTVKPVERYTGPWNKPLKHPILILNNHFDPETPLASAREVASLMGPSNAVLVTRDGYGHCVLGHPSRCMAGVIANFYNHGTLPPTNTNCPVDGNPFVPADVRGDDDKFADVANATTQLAQLVWEARRQPKAPHSPVTKMTLVEEEKPSTWQRFVLGLSTVLTNLVLI
ncbi:Aste57867_17244 [Aphanomyces stellatus]|uniref:Aste57867_17244 protein n=1 Tax=Aphanomyces stellatus TaxID=120398 RepID=A0A485L843_9STRA|nr:hypothetical protein As57867_017185 [Aphanomyces stellatus]VFT94000.1 Aste57867_17244 [Aphanomyces stellatus]